MCSSIRALVIRDIKKRIYFSSGTRRITGLAWMFLEPLFHVLVLTLAKFMYGVQNHGMDSQLFILLGVIPFLFFKTSITYAAKAIRSNKNIFVFRQIQPIDVVIAGWISNIFIWVLVTLCLFVFLSFFNIYIVMLKQGDILILILLLLILSLGINMCVASFCFLFTSMSKLIKFTNRALYFFSGIFYMPSDIPSNLRSIFLINPLFQVIQGLRESFEQKEVTSKYSNLEYLFVITFFILFTGLLSYFLLRKKIKKQIGSI